MIIRFIKLSYDFTIHIYAVHNNKKHFYRIIFNLMVRCLYAG